MGRHVARSAGLFAGMVADAVLGDPRRGHPVALFGSLAATIERRMYHDSRIAGVTYFTALAGAAACVGRLAERTAARSSSRQAVLTAAVAWAVVGGRSLGREAQQLAAALESGDVATARARLPALCGRDPRELGEKELSRATVESVAENTSDAVVAPLFWGAVAGIPGLVGYRAVNTLDAMVGHRSARYARFGWASARADDLANWAPARITGLLTVLCAPVAAGSPGQAWHILRRDGSRHPSPNGGRCEAAFAGALGVRLGGVNRYGSRVEHRPELGDGPPPAPADISRAVCLGRAVAGAATVLSVAAPLAGRSR